MDSYVLQSIKEFPQRKHVVVVGVSNCTEASKQDVNATLSAGMNKHQFSDLALHILPANIALSEQEEDGKRSHHKKFFPLRELTSILVVLLQSML